jgi:hypothetical protein
MNRDEYQALPYARKLEKAEQPDFVEWVSDQGMSAEEYLGIDGATRAERCIRPIVIRITGDASSASGVYTGPGEFIMPCGNNNANVCPYCAKHNAKLRQRQMMQTLTNGPVRCALFTLTAPSFGAVHRAYWTEKDEWRYRNLEPGDLERVMDQKRENSKKCPCGGLHTYLDDIAGSPVFLSKAKKPKGKSSPSQHGKAKTKGYDYAGETIWNTNLPNLMEATYAKLKRVAADLGIEKDNLRLFTVFEQQRRGSLHSHILVVVVGEPRKFAELVETLDPDNGLWQSPTSRIPSELVAHYESPLAQDRFTEVLPRLLERGIHVSKTPAEAIPYALWKGRTEPATTFGPQADIRVLDPDPETPEERIGEPKTFNQVAGYLSKYLTKSQSGYAPDALKKLHGKLHNHYYAHRCMSLALLSDYILYDVERRQLAKYRSQTLDARSETISTGTGTLLKANHATGELVEEPDTDPTLPMLVRAIYDHAHRGVVRARLIDLLLPTDLKAPSLYDSPLTRERLLDVLDTYELATFFSPTSYVSLKIRLNKLGNNAGFTGTLTRVSNWGVTMASIKEEQRKYASDTDAVSYEYGGLLLDRMEQERVLRDPIKPFVQPESEPLNETLAHDLGELPVTNDGLDFARTYSYTEWNTKNERYESSFARFLYYMLWADEDRTRRIMSDEQMDQLHRLKQDLEQGMSAEPPPY